MCIQNSSHAVKEIKIECHYATSGPVQFLNKYASAHVEDNRSEVLFRNT